MKERLPFMLAFLLVAGMTQANVQNNKPMLILNEDDNHFFGSRSAEQMNLDGLQAFVDQYANTMVSHLFLCPNAMKASHRRHSRRVRARTPAVSS